MNLRNYIKQTDIYKVFQRNFTEKKIKKSICDTIWKDPSRITNVENKYEIMVDLPPVIYHISEASLQANYKNIEDQVSKRFISDLYGTITEIKNLTELFQNIENVKKEQRKLQR